MAPVQYEVTLADMEAFWDTEFTGSLKGKLKRVALWQSLILAAVIYWLLNRHLHNEAGAVATAAAVALLVFFAFPSVMRDLHRRSMRRTYRDASDTALGRFTLTVTADQLCAAGPASRSEVEWKAVQELRLTPSHAFMYLGPQKALIVPLVQLDATSRENLIQFLKGHIKKVATVA